MMSLYSNDELNAKVQDDNAIIIMNGRTANCNINAVFLQCFLLKMQS